MRLQGQHEIGGFLLNLLCKDKSPDVPFEKLNTHSSDTFLFGRASTARHEAHRGDSGFAEANAGLQPAAVLKPDRDNETSVIRGPAIRKAGWLNSNGAVKHTAACEKSYISGG